MTATQVFYRFLKEELTINEFVFFNRMLRGESPKLGTYRVSPPRVKTKTFVEDYLACGRGRSLNGYMINLMRYICPRLSHKRSFNKDYYRTVYSKWNWYNKKHDDYISRYNELWHKFLEKHIQNADVKIYHGEYIDYLVK